MINMITRMKMKTPTRLLLPFAYVTLQIRHSKNYFSFILDMLFQ
jgi:hypothetical protein